MTAGGINYDPSKVSGLVFTEGIGAWRTTAPRNSDRAFVYTSFSAPIQQLVSNRIVSPPGGNPLYFAWDRPEFYLTPNQYPMTQSGCANPQPTRSSWVGTAIGHRPTPGLSSRYVITFTCKIDESGISTDGGKTWKAFGFDHSPFNCQGMRALCAGGSSPRPTARTLYGSGATVRVRTSPPEQNTWVPISISGISAAEVFVALL